MKLELLFLPGLPKAKAGRLVGQEKIVFVTSLGEGVFTPTGTKLSFIMFTVQTNTLNGHLICEKFPGHNM